MKLSSLRNKGIVASATLLAAIMAAPLMVQADTGAVSADTSPLPLSISHAKVLPLYGGSNFRDMGGYTTEDNKTVRSGLLFRSGVMTNLTDADIAYLNRLNFETIVDLRSQEELELFPNRWIQSSDINYLNHEYSIADLLAKNSGNMDDYKPGDSYRSMPMRLKPQLKMYFDQLIAGNAPIVVNCHAGQDRTGVASALLLSALGVPRDVVIQDYLLSTAYRRPAVELGSVDLASAAEENVFAKLMLKYTDQVSAGPQPLLTDEQVPYLVFAFEEIDNEYGSVENFLKREIDVSDAELAQLKAHYLE